jgi:hypothetical protein
MAVEVANFVFAKRPALGRLRKSFSSVSAKWWRSSRGLEQVAEKMFGQQAGVLREAKTMRLRKRAMRRYRCCAKFISARVRASASSSASRFCRLGDGDGLGWFSVTCAVVLRLENPGRWKPRGGFWIFGAANVALVNSCVS